MTDGHRGHHLDAQAVGEPGDVDADASPSGLVHHVETEHARQLHLRHLEGELENPLEVVDTM